MHVTPEMLKPLIAFVVVVAIAIVIIWRLRGQNAKSARQQAAELRAAEAFEEMSMLSFKLRKELKDKGIASPESAPPPAKPLTDLYPGPKSGGSSPKGS